MITDLISDLGDGVLLPELTRALTGNQINYRADPKLTFHRLVIRFVSIHLTEGVVLSVIRAGRRNLLIGFES